MEIVSTYTICNVNPNTISLISEYLLYYWAFRVSLFQSLSRGLSISLYFSYKYKALIFSSLSSIMVESFIRSAIDSKLTVFYNNCLMKQLFVGVDKITYINFLSEKLISPYIYKVQSWYKLNKENSRSYKIPSGRTWW